MSKGAVYEKGGAWWIRFITPGGDRVDRSAHTTDEQEAQQLLQTFTALAELCHLYAVPFDPDDTLPDIAAELAAARAEVEHVFGQIRCPHCSRRIVPEFEPKGLRTGAENSQLSRGATQPAECPLSSGTGEDLTARVASDVVRAVTARLGGEQLTERVVYDVVKGVVARLEGEIRKMVANAVGPRKPKCVTKGCKDFAFAKGLCQKHYYRDYHAKRVKQERGGTEGK